MAGLCWAVIGPIDRKREGNCALPFPSQSGGSKLVLLPTTARGLNHLVQSWADIITLALGSTCSLYNRRKPPQTGSIGHLARSSAPQTKQGGGLDTSDVFQNGRYKQGKKKRTKKRLNHLEWRLVSENSRIN